VLFECDSRLLIGARASVRITTTDASVMVTGKVVRSRVKGLVNGALRYDAALALDEDLMLAMPAEPEVAAPDHTLDDDPSTPAWRAEDGMGEEAQAEVAASPSEDPGLLQLFATVPHDLAALRKLASDNQW
jgi:hypothetical protein